MLKEDIVSIDSHMCVIHVYIGIHASILLPREKETTETKLFFSCNQQAIILFLHWTL